MTLDEKMKLRERLVKFVVKNGTSMRFSKVPAVAERLFDYIVDGELGEEDEQESE